jgi:hypothetical protein
MLAGCTCASAWGEQQGQYCFVRGRVRDGAEASRPLRGALGIAEELRQGRSWRAASVFVEVWTGGGLHSSQEPLMSSIYLQFVHQRGLATGVAVCPLALSFGNDSGCRRSPLCYAFDDEHQWLPWDLGKKLLAPPRLALISPISTLEAFSPEKGVKMSISLFGSRFKLTDYCSGWVGVDWHFPSTLYIPWKQFVIILNAAVPSFWFCSARLAGNRLWPLWLSE